MIFEWDERKDRANIAKHGIAFQLAASVFDDPFRLDDLNRVVAGEERRHVIGMAGDTLLVLFVVYTSRSKHGQETIRIISARKASQEYANILPGCQSLATALRPEIEIWLLLKEGRPDEAWNRLIDAEYALADAVRAHAIFSHLTSQLDRLLVIERIVFPPQVFLSSGMLVKSQLCTVCGGEYEECDHVKGRPYMGEFCGVRLIPSKVDHVAIVDEPANKRCRIFKFGVEGGYRDLMTWAIEPPAEKDGPPLTGDESARKPLSQRPPHS